MLDIIIIIFILFGAIIGFKRGIIKQSVITLGMILVLILSFILKNPVSLLMYKNLPFFTFGGLLENISILNILIYEGIAFLLVFGLLSTLLIILIKISSIFEKLLRVTIILAIPSKLLGALFGIIEYYLIVFIFLFLLSSPLFGLNDNKLFSESKLRKTILEKTPFVSSKIEGTLSAVYDIDNLIKQKKNLSASEFNCKSIKIMIDNNIIEDESIEYLYSKNKIKKCEIGE